MSISRVDFGRISADIAIDENSISRIKLNLF